MSNMLLNDFEKNFFTTNKTFCDDRDNIIIRLSLKHPIESETLTTSIEKTLQFFPNLQNRVALDKNNAPYLYKVTDKNPQLIKSKSLSDLHKPFNLETGETMRYYYGDGALFLSTHHFYFDEDSLRSLVDILCSIIKNDNTVFEVPTPTQTTINNNHTAYWIDKLHNNCGPCQFFAPDDNIHGLGVAESTIRNLEPKKLSSFAFDNSTSINAITIMTTALILRKLLHNNDIIVATPVTTRNDDLSNQLKCGCRINVLPLQISIDASKTFSQLLESVTNDLWDDIGHRDFSFSELIKELHINHEVGLYNVMAEFTDEDVNENSFIVIPNNTPKMDFSLSLIKRNNKLLLHIEYDKQKISDKYIGVILNTFGFVLEQITNNPHETCSSLRLCTNETEKKIKQYGMGKHSVCNTDLVGRFTTFAKQYPNKTAIIHNNNKISYGSLLNRVACISNGLKKLPIAKGALIGINLERSIDYIATQLALMASGHPFVPLDKALPPDRIMELSHEAKIEFIVSDSPSLSITGTKVLDIQNLITTNDNELIPENVNEKDLAYVIFTSGSTGKPKGVMINRLGFANHQEIMIDYLHLSEKSIVAQSAPVSFDISIWQLICPLLVGGTVDIIDKNILIDPENMLNKIVRDEITVLEIVPSLLSEYLDYEAVHKQRVFTNISTITTGESIAKKIAKKWSERYPSNALINAYGPAEASDDTHFFNITPKSLFKYNDIPVGAPLNNIGTLVLDCDHQICPSGIIGEICIYGISLANGYINNKVKTTESFKYTDCIKDIVYYTGDYGRWIDPGVLGYNGRRDNQVKVRGQRTELGEIEEKIREILDTEKVAVVLHDYGNNKRLVCFVESARKIDTNNIKNGLAKTLPCFMVPWKIIVLNKLPTNNNGKLDRRSLDASCDSTSFLDKEEEDADDVKTVISVWKRLLCCEVKSDSDFFDLGGDSLLCLTAANELNKKGLLVSPRDIIHERTPLNIIEHLQQQDSQCMATEIAPLSSNIQDNYLELSGQHKNNGEIQACIYQNHRLTSKNVFLLLEDIQRLLPFLKLSFKNDLIKVTDESKICDFVEKMRREIHLDKCNAFVTPFVHNNKIKLLFIVHHYYFDIYSWKIIDDAICNILKGHKDKIVVSDDTCLRLSLSKRSCNNITIHSSTTSDLKTTEMNSFKIKKCYSIAFIKQRILSLLHQIGILTGDSSIILNEASIRAEDAKATKNSIGWGTFYEAQEYRYKTSDISYVNGHRRIDVTDEHPLVVLNIVPNDLISNANIKILPTIINRDASFIETDITVSENGFSVSVQSNLANRAKIFKKLRDAFLEDIDLPVSSSQYGFLIGSDFGTNDTYREQIVVEIPVAKMEAIKKRILFATHNSAPLRTVFYEKNNYIYQKDSGIPTPLITTISCAESELKNILKDERLSIPNLRILPPIRYAFIKVSRHLYLSISYNHALLDGDSVFFLLDYISGDNSTHNLSSNTSISHRNKRAARTYWNDKTKEMHSSDFAIFKSTGPTSLFKQQRTYDDKVLQFIRETAKEHLTTPATIIQSIFNCWGMQYFNKERFGYGLVCNTRHTAVNLNSLAPSINTIPFLSTDNDLKNNIKATITENHSNEAFKEYPLKEILALMTNNRVSFDVLLTITTRSAAKKDYNIIYTYEETDFPFTADFDILNNGLLATFASNRSINTTDAISSFSNYLSSLVVGKEIIVKPVSIINKTPSDSSQLDNLSFKKAVSEVLGIDSKNIGWEDSFISNGGDSILAVRLKSRINLYGFDVSVGSILSSPTLSDLRLQTYTLDKAAIDNLPNPLEDILRDYARGHESNYHEQAAFCLLGSYSHDGINVACSKLGDRVESLKQIYHKNNLITTTHSTRVKYNDIENTYSDFAEFIDAISKYDRGRPFYPDKDELLRIYTARSKNGSQWYLFISFSALVTDGWSFSSLLKHFMIIYSANKDAQLNSQKNTFLNIEAQKNDHIKECTIESESTKIHESIIRKKKAIVQKKVTESMFFEEALTKVLKKLDFNIMLRYENCRHELKKSIDDIGYYTKYSTIFDSHNTNNNNAVYVFENYPKDAENDLRDGLVDGFTENGNWRLPLLPPNINYGFYIEKQDNDYLISCYYDKYLFGNNALAKTVLQSLKEELRNAE